MRKRRISSLIQWAGRSLDLDVFNGNVVDLLGHGLDYSAPTRAQAQAALGVHFHQGQAILQRMLRYSPSQWMSSSSSPEQKYCYHWYSYRLLQLPQNDVSTRAIVYHAIRLLFLTRKSHAAALCCLSCSCLQAPPRHRSSRSTLSSGLSFIKGIPVIVCDQSGRIGSGGHRSILAASSFQKQSGECSRREKEAGLADTVLLKDVYFKFSSC